MDVKSELWKIVHETMLDVAQKVAGLNLEQGGDPPQEDTFTFSVSTTGAYSLTLLFHIDQVLMHKIADHMSRGSAQGQADVVMYDQEFFNILCGNVISQINRRYKSSARFGIPAFGRQVPPEPKASITISWQCDEGRIKVYGVLNGEESSIQNLENSIPEGDCE